MGETSREADAADRKSRLSVRTLLGMALLIIGGLVGNNIGLPLFELVAGVWLIWVGRQHSFHIVLGISYLIAVPFVWSRVPVVMIPTVSFALLGVLCIAGSVYEHVVLTKQSQAVS